MSNSNRLPLTSQLWNRLGTFGVAPERVPLIIRHLIEEPANPTHPGLDELTAAIFHQHSLADATYAVFPYLVDIHARYENTSPRPFYLAANIASSANFDRADLPHLFRLAFLDALREFELIAISKVMTKGKQVRDVYNTCVAAMAFSQHCCGNLLRDVLDPETDGTKRTYLVCPACQCQFEVTLFEEGTVVIEGGRVSQPTKPPEPLGRPLIRSHPKRQPNPWEVVGSFLSQEAPPVSMSDTERLHVEMATRLCAQGFGPGVPPDDAFSLIGSILLAHCFADSARRFFRLWDSVTCPKCKSTFVAAKGWWGCAM